MDDVTHDLVKLHSNKIKTIQPIKLIVSYNNPLNNNELLFMSIILIYRTSKRSLNNKIMKIDALITKEQKTCFALRSVFGGSAFWLHYLTAIDGRPWKSSVIIFELASFSKTPLILRIFQRKGCKKKAINTEMILQFSTNSQN